MSAELKTIIWFLLTITLMGFFAGVEMAYYSASRLNIELRRNQGTKEGLLLGKFVDNPTRFIGMTLIGFNFFLVFLGLQISTVMEPLWRRWQIGSDAVHLLVEVTIATLVVLILAEFTPRAIFRAKSSSLLSKLSGVIDVFYQLAGPVADKLAQLADWMLKYIFNVRTDKHKEPLSLVELKNLFEQNETNERQDYNTQLLENAQEFPKIRIRQCLVPRKEIVGVSSQTPIEEVWKKFVETKLSKLIVYDNNIDHIVGYIHQTDMFRKPASISEVLLAIPAVPESMSAADLMGKFSRERRSIAWVVDEFGGTAGIITMEDVLEELFGEIQDEYDTEKFVEKQLSENEFIFSGRLELDYLEEKYGLHFPENESETLSGYIINFHETIPRQKERIIIENYEFDVVNVSDTRIETVKLKKLK